MVVNENFGYYFCYKKVRQTTALYTTDVINIYFKKE